MFSGYPRSESTWHQYWKKKWFLEQARDQVKYFIKIGSQESNSISEAIKENDWNKSCSNQNMKDMIIFMFEFSHHEKVNMTDLKGHGQKNIDDK